MIIVICALGNPCVIMEENPAKYYTTKSECMANSSTKHKDIIDTYLLFGMQVETSHFDCEKIEGLTNT